ncbi:peptidase inhibitor 16-like [Cololabis saira]|uniref:peptidase inhibitor 16-like n=1 Tax=Cololabis saira TaxID=129043 RepID=UPI002AD46168|nr:peptidase inhibitor 16-like [Cololabis saira]
MHRRSLLDLQGALCPRTTQDGAPSWCSRLNVGSKRRSPLTGALVWASLLLGALLVPGAQSFLTEEQEELLVDLHNHYRGQVSPTAAAMLPLKWDPNLKVLAEGYAAKCIWNHNPELEDTGENLFADNGPLDLSKAMEKWFLEHLDYEYHNNSCEEDKMCGHYTQMVWADTHRVGCAFHHCNTMEGLEWERVSFLVCNYFPAGNFEDQRPYMEGEWCSMCPDDYQNCENNLCALDMGDVEGTPDPSLQPPYGVSTGPHPSDQLETTSLTPDVAATLLTDSSEDSPPPVTTVDGPSGPGVPSATLGQREEGKVLQEDRHRTEGANREDETWKNVDLQKTPHSNVCASSVSAPSVLLACLTGSLMFRL